MIRSKGNEKKRWHAIYTKPRWEKKVFQLLLENGVEAYCPLNKVKRKWSDRIKLVEEPLFKSYVFVRVAEDGKTAVRMTPGVVNFVYWLGKPAIIRDKEIVVIKRFLDEYDVIEASPIQDIHPNNRVVIKGGAMMDKQGVVKRVLNNKVEVVLDSIGFKLVAFFEKSKISVIKKSSNPT